jgi:hypothetical protein
MDKNVQIHVDFGIYKFQSKRDMGDRKSYVDVNIDVSDFENFMAWYNKGGNLDDSKLDEYVNVINSLKSAFEKEFSDIICLSEYTTNSCYVQVGPFSFYNYWKTEEYMKLRNLIVNRTDYDSKRDNASIIAASKLKDKYSDKRKFKIMSFVTIGIYENTMLKKKLENSIEIFDNDQILYNKLFPSYIKPILVGVTGVLVSLFVGYVAHILANSDEYNQNAGSKKRFSGGNSIQVLIANIDKTSLSDEQKNELNAITTSEELKNFIDTHLKKLSKEENEQIKKELQKKLKPEEKEIIKDDFPDFELKDDDTVFGFLEKEMKAGKPLTKRHRKKRQNKKRKSRKSKK